MFIKQSLWKSLIKGAIETIGLNIYMTHSGMLVLHGQFWTINVDYNYMPKEYKAVLVQYVGDIPKAGEAWMVLDDTIEEDMNEWHMESLNLYPNAANNYIWPYRQTRYSYQDKRGSFRFIRGTGGIRNVVAIGEEFIDGINMKAVNEEVETAPVGPNGNSDDGMPEIAWYNNCALLAVKPAESNVRGAIEAFDHIREFLRSESLALTLEEEAARGDADV